MANRAERDADADTLRLLGVRWGRSDAGTADTTHGIDVRAHRVRALDDVGHDLGRLTGTEYLALALVITRPPRGLGALVAGAVALQIAWPNFNFNNTLRGRVLALTADREVQEWVLTTDEIGLPARMADGDYLGTIDRRSMKLGHRGVVVIRADWDHGPGWVPRRGLGDWEAVAGTQPRSAFGPRY